MSDTAPMTAEERETDNQLIVEALVATAAQARAEGYAAGRTDGYADGAGDGHAEGTIFGEAKGFAAGMEEAAGIADAEEVPEADDAPSALREVCPVQAAISAIVVTKACIAAAIRARAAEKDDGWRLGPPDAGVLCIMEIEYRVDDRLTRERIVAYVDEQDDELSAENGDSIGWPKEVVVRHCPLPPAGDPTP